MSGRFSLSSGGHCENIMFFSERVESGGSSFDGFGLSLNAAAIIRESQFDRNSAARCCVVPAVVELLREEARLCEAAIVVTARPGAIVSLGRVEFKPGMAVF